MTGLTRTRPRPRSTSRATGRPPSASTDARRDGRLARPRRARDRPLTRLGRAGVIAGLIRRTVGVRDALRRQRRGASPSRRALPVELVGRERGALAAGAHGPAGARRRAPEARPGGAPERRLDEHLEPRLAPRLRRARGTAAGRRRACGPASRRPSGRAARPRAPASAREQRRRSRGERLVGPAPRSRARGRAPIPRWPRLPSAVATTYSTSSGQQARRVDLGRRSRRRTAASPTGRRGSPRRRAAARTRSTAPSATSSRCRDRESTSNGRPSGPIMSTRVARPHAARASRRAAARRARGSSASRSRRRP